MDSFLTESKETISGIAISSETSSLARQEHVPTNGKPHLKKSHIAYVDEEVIKDAIEEDREWMESLEKETRHVNVDAAAAAADADDDKNTLDNSPVDHLQPKELSSSSSSSPLHQEPLQLLAEMPGGPIPYAKHSVSVYGHLDSPDYRSIDDHVKNLERELLEDPGVAVGYKRKEDTVYGRPGSRDYVPVDEDEDEAVFRGRHHANKPVLVEAAEDEAISNAGPPPTPKFSSRRRPPHTERARNSNARFEADTKEGRDRPRWPPKRPRNGLENKYYDKDERDPALPPRGVRKPPGKVF